MGTTEHTINDALAAVLRNTRRIWQKPNVVKSENTGRLKGSNARPDILVLEPNVSPVVIETEVLPATTVEKEAKSRLGAQLQATGRTILSSIAVRLPLRLREKEATELQEELAKANDIEMALFTGSTPSNCTRWPKTGWIKGSAADLSILAQSASIPPGVIEDAAEQLVNGVTAAAGLLDEMGTTHPGATQTISKELRQEGGKQTWRMAATILANAFVFHESLANGPGELEALQYSNGNGMKVQDALARRRASRRIEAR